MLASQDWLGLLSVTPGPGGGRPFIQFGYSVPSTLFKKGTIIGFVTCEHGSTLGGKNFVYLDHDSLDFQFKRGNFE